MRTRPFALLPALLLGLLAPPGAATAADDPIEVEELPPAAAESAPAPPASPPAGEPAAAVSEADAVRLYADGDLAAARDVYDQLAARPGDDRERARFALQAASLAWQLDDRAGALARLESALYLDPAVEFRTELFAADFVAAYHDARRVALHRRKVASSQGINRAVEALRGGDLETARRLLDEALRLVPDDPDAVYNLALVDLRAGDEAAALAGFERVLALERGNPEGVTRDLKVQSLNNAAVVYFGNGDFLDAETALAEAVRLVPGDANAWFNLALTRQKLGRPAEAYEALRRAHSLAPGDAATQRALALAEMERGDWVAAVALLVEATRAAPDDADLRLQLGRAQQGLGNAAGAVESYRAALDLAAVAAPETAVVAARLLAEAQRAAGDAAGSAATARRLLELRPGDADGWLYLGLAELARHDPAAAVAALERARQAAPARADIVHNLGTAYLAALDYDNAAAAFREAVALDPENAEARAALDRIAARAATPAAERSELGARLSVGDYPELGLRGLRVDAVAPGSAAARAGLRPGDLVLRADGRPVGSPDALLTRLGEKRGATTLAVLREGQTLELRLRLD